jgi:predicted nucleotidyltransferase
MLPKEIIHADAFVAHVADILKRYLDESYAIFLFGSRADGTAHAKSDFDFGILGEQTVPLTILTEIQDAIQKSPTLFQADIVDFLSVDESFRAFALKTKQDLR